jgi:hypothetical protein
VIAWEVPAGPGSVARGEVVVRERSRVGVQLGFGLVERLVAVAGGVPGAVRFVVVVTRGEMTFVPSARQVGRRGAQEISANFLPTLFLRHLELLSKLKRV